MFNSQKVLEISKVSKAEKWPFPKTLNALQEAGIESYDVELTSSSIVYHGSGKQLKEEHVESLTKMPPLGRIFNVKALKEAIHIHQVKRTPYSEVMKEVVKAGIPRYRVDIHKRSCTYFGNAPGEEYTEFFPD